MALRLGAGLARPRGKVGGGDAAGPSARVPLAQANAMGWASLSATAVPGQSGAMERPAARQGGAQGDGRAVHA